ncbi:2'-5' RNA ligase family protein [Streptomyces niveus]|uniref:2'-5' RNA ligase family protein n=1 Tax=Streptomyces niveus TaxID=193462 RepID=UPI0036ABD296
MKDFFESVETRPTAPWPAGRRDLHWHLLPPSTEQTVDALLGPYGDLIRYPGMEMVLPKWLHVTVLHAGPHAEASDEEIAQMTALVREAVAGTGPVSLTFSRPSVGTVAIERAARPGAAARALWDATWSATEQVVGERWQLLPEIYNPHMTIAYAGADADHADRAAMKSELSDINAGEVTLEFPTLSLVSQRHNHKRITWELLATVPLG